jgi:hypothetical protein
VAIGRDMERALVALGCDPERIEVIPNWADGKLIRPLVSASRLKTQLFFHQTPELHVPPDADPRWSFNPAWQFVPSTQRGEDRSIPDPIRG